MNAGYARHVRVWTLAGGAPLTLTEYHLSLKSRAALLLSGNIEEWAWTPERLAAVERVEGWTAANQTDKAIGEAMQLLQEVKAETKWT